MKKILLAIMILSTTVVSAVELDSIGRNHEYVNTILGRTNKFVEKLEVSSDIKTEVNKIVANRYFQLNDIYEKRDKQKTEIKESSISKEEKDAKLKAIEDEKDAALYRSHFAFPAALSLYLNDKQIEEIKDGMTYGVVMVTYKSHLDMIPSLTQEEKDQILAWLIEAREFAMDAENSNKKHEAFGKYKGRINNYLAKRGYNLTKEREEWYKRIEAAKAKK